MHFAFFSLINTLRIIFVLFRKKKSRKQFKKNIKCKNTFYILKLLINYKAIG